MISFSITNFDFEMWFNHILIVRNNYRAVVAYYIWTFVTLVDSSMPSGSVGREAELVLDVFLFLSDFFLQTLYLC